MGIIQELTPLLTNQIAAGEVIERPASVVKELLENAVDAKSTRIVIDIEEAGLKKITITDNGTGMSLEDARMAIKRHTTSKLYSPEQLFRIRTLGFRGEALASITAVSKVKLTTSTGETVGSELHVAAGKIIQEKEVAPLKGTTIEVSELFFNTPARLKFVRSLQTELAHITDVVGKISLSHPEIAIILRNEGNELIRTSGTGDLRQAIAGNFGPNQARKMIAFSGEDADFKVAGFTSLPELTRSSRHYMSIFINGRSIRNIAISKAIVRGYGSTLMVGRFPISVITIETDAQLIDVNVHPTKQEVRISKETELTTLIDHSIEQALRTVQRIPESLDSLTFTRREPDHLNKQIQQQPLQFSFSNTSLPASSIEEKLPPIESYVETNEALEEKVSPGEQPIISPTFQDAASDHLTTEVGRDEHQPDANYFMLANQLEDVHPEQRFPELHYFGQMHGTYLFAQNENGLYMIDQHAAQERIKYEEYKVTLGQVAPMTQPLMIPIVLEYSKKDAVKLQERLPLIQELGIEIEPFGTQAFQIQSHPSWMTVGQEKETIEEIIALILENQQVSVAQVRKATAIMMSCKRSIKANHRLTDMEARQLLLDLAACQNPYNCPHGRPVMVHLTTKDLEKLFKRIQDPHRSMRNGDSIL